MAEEKQLLLESKIISLNSEELLKLSDYLKLESAQYEGKTKRFITKVIRSHVEENCDSLETDEEKISYLESLFKVVDSHETPSETEIEMKKLQDELDELESKQKAIKEKLTEAQNSSSVKQATITKATVDKATMDKTAVEDKFVNISIGGTGHQSWLRREFKIQGIVGEPNQKDKLGYRALLTQIESGQNKGYTEHEIISAVIRAVQAGLQLRSYLESLNNLTLEKLRKILRSHFHEKNATELYQVLANMSQGPTEDPQSFVIRALTVRQQILLASEEESEAGITYDKKSVQKLFLHTLETGLTNEIIRAKIRVLTKNPNVLDEELIEAVNLAMSAEEERNAKFARGYKVKTNKVNVIEGVNSTASKNTESKHENEILATLKAMQTELTSLRSDVETFRKNEVSKNYQKERKPKGCDTCQAKGEGEGCSHCYICGGENHLARHCKMKAKKQGNANRLPPRDRK